MNTSANPVPIDEDNSARHGFTLSCHGAQDCWTTPSASDGPSVVDFVYIYNPHPNSATDNIASLTFMARGIFGQFVMIPLTPNTRSTLSTAVMPIKLYVDLQTLKVDCAVGDCYATVSGHRITNP
jgi:hypothetical protein